MEEGDNGSIGTERTICLVTVLKLGESKVD